MTKSFFKKGHALHQNKLFVVALNRWDAQLHTFGRDQKRTTLVIFETKFQSSIKFQKFPKAPRDALVVCREKVSLTQLPTTSILHRRGSLKIAFLLGSLGSFWQYWGPIMMMMMKPDPFTYYLQVKGLQVKSWLSSSSKFNVIIITSNIWPV